MKFNQFIYFLFFSFFVIENQVFAMHKFYQQTKEKFKSLQWTDKEIKEIWSIISAHGHGYFYNETTGTMQLPDLQKMNYEQFKQKFMDLGEIERRGLYNLYNYKNDEMYKKSKLHDMFDFGTFVKMPLIKKRERMKKYFQNLSKYSITILKNMLDTTIKAKDADVIDRYHLPKQEVINYIKAEIINKKGVKGHKGESNKDEIKKEPMPASEKKERLPGTSSSEDLE